MTAAAFSACFADWKLIRGRKVVQLVFEVPLEKADEAYNVVGGMPDPSTSKWFAIAALNKEVQQPHPQPSRETLAPAGGEHLKKSWDEILPSQQAGILCADPKFWIFLSEKKGALIHVQTGQTECATWVRQYLKLNSRADITPNSPAALAKWRELVVDYRLWSQAVI